MYNDNCTTNSSANCNHEGSFYICYNFCLHTNWLKVLLTILVWNHPPQNDLSSRSETNNKNQAKLKTSAVLNLYMDCTNTCFIIYGNYTHRFCTVLNTTYAFFRSQHMFFLLQHVMHTQKSIQRARQVTDRNKSRKDCSHSYCLFWEPVKQNNRQYV